MSNIVRFGVSLDADLLEKFDALRERRAYQTRSEAIRDLLRATLIQQDWEDEQKETAATLTLVYDHHISDLSQRLTDMQHDYHHLIKATLHVHLDHDNCLEVLVLNGKSAEMRELSQKLIALRGVKYGNLSLATTGRGLA